MHRKIPMTLLALTLAACGDKAPPTQPLGNNAPPTPAPAPAAARLPMLTYFTMSG